MKKSHLLGALCATVFSLCVAVPAEAFLMTRLDGAAAYDTVLDITWTTDASLSGLNNWYDLVAWADSLEYLGFDDWRLASLEVSAGLPVGRTSGLHSNCRYATELACRDNELGYMFYHNLGGIYPEDLTGTQTTGDVTLTNIQNSYWSSTEIDDNGAWGFWFNPGVQDFIPDFKVEDRYGWAVRNGDVAAVPEPPMVLLLATGLIGLIGRARIKPA